MTAALPSTALRPLPTDVVPAGGQGALVAAVLAAHVVAVAALWQVAQEPAPTPRIDAVEATWIDAPHATAERPRPLPLRREPVRPPQPSPASPALAVDRAPAPRPAVPQRVPAPPVVGAPVSRAPAVAPPSAPAAPAAAPRVVEPAASVPPGPAPASASGPRAAASDPVESPRPAEPAVPKTLTIGAVEYLEPPVPAYPLAARRLREEGRVHVRVLVDALGRAAEAAVTRGSGSARLDEAALAAVRAARFRPYTENGVALPFRVVVPLIFELEH